MIKLILKNKIFALFLLSLMIVPFFTLNAALVTCGRCAEYNADQTCKTPSSGVTAGAAETKPCTLCDFLKLGQNIINFLTYDIALVATAMAVAAGGLWILLSGGIPERRTKGKDIITTAVWGALIVLASWIIVNEIMITIATGPGLKAPWYEIKC